MSDSNMEPDAMDLDDEIIPASKQPDVVAKVAKSSSQAEAKLCYFIDKFPPEVRLNIYKFHMLDNGFDPLLIPGHLSTDYWYAPQYLGFPDHIRTRPPLEKMKTGSPNIIIEHVRNNDPVCFMHSEQTNRPCEAQRLPLLSTCHLIRDELIPELFKKRLTFSRLWDTEKRMPEFIPRLPTKIRNTIRKVSIDIRCRMEFDENYGNFIIPYLALLPNLEFVELHFSPQFYKFVVANRSSDQDPEPKLHIFKCLMKLLVFFTNLPQKDLKVQVGKAYGYGDELLKKTGHDYEDGIADPVQYSDLEWHSKDPKELDLYPEIPQAEVDAQEKKDFDSMYTGLFIQAVKLRSEILELPAAVAQNEEGILTHLQAPRDEFYETIWQEKMAQIKMDIEPFFEWPSENEVARLNVEQILVQKSPVVYEKWMKARHQIPQCMLDVMINRTTREWRQIGYHDPMILDMKRILEEI